MSKSIARTLAVALVLNALGFLHPPARALEALSLSPDLPPLDKRGSWRETLEDLNSLGVPQNWTILGPIANETAKSFDRKLEPELSDDWSRPMTDNLGRLFKTAKWSKPKDDDGCYVDLYDVFSNPPVSPVAYAETVIDSPVDGSALLWFENAGRAIVYFNNRQILSATGKIDKLDSNVRALYPIPIELKRGHNVLKIKILKEKHQTQKGWGFFARVERDDLEWRRLLLGKLKELYPEEDAAQPGASERLMQARRLEKSGHPESAIPLYKEVAEKYAAFEDASEDARDALKRLAAHAPAENPGEATKAWAETDKQFKAALATAQTISADRILRDYISRFPFSEQAGLALCGRGGLRLDYACEDSARPFYERALREYSGNETVRTLGVKGLEFARFYMPERTQLDTNRVAETALAAIQRQLRNGNAHDNAAGLKAFAELLVSQPGALVRTDGTELYPRWASLNLLAQEFQKTLSPEERALFREPLLRPSEFALRQASAFNVAADFEDVARRFPGAPASAKALNVAGNAYLDRGQSARAAQAFHDLLRDFKGSGLINEPLVAAKEIRALEQLHQTQEARDALQRLNADYGAAKLTFGGREISVSDFTRATENRLAALPAASTASVKSDSATFAANTRRLGAPAGTPAPTPDHLQWQNPVPPQSDFAVHARSAWSEDRTFAHIEAFPMAAADKLFFATRQDVRALNLATGKEVWKDSWRDASYVDLDRFSDGNKNKFCGFPQTLPVVKDERLFVRIISSNKYSVLRCYDAASGSLKWDTEKNPALTKLVWSSEPLATGTLIVATYFEALDHDTVRCGVAALDAVSGKLIWNRPFGVGTSGIRIAEKYKESRYTQVNYRVTLQLGPPSAFDGTIYTATGLGSLAALNAQSGEIAWIAEYPRLRAGNLNTGNSGIDGFTPRMLKVLARGPSSPVVGDTVVALAPRDAAGIVAFDRRTGAFRWAHELLDARFIAGVCDGKLIAADDTVTALNLDSGKIAWEYSGTGKRLTGQPGFSGGLLYLPTDDDLSTLDARTGEFKSRLKWDAKTHGALANFIVTGSSVIGINNSTVAAIGSK